jgi:alpha-glucosidase
LPWKAEAGHGWGKAETWLPFPPAADVRNAETLRADSSTILHLYRRLLELRRDTPALRRGDLTLLDAPAGVLAYRRSAGGESRIVLVNFTSEPVSILDASELGEAAAGRSIDFVSDVENPGERFDGILAADQAVILR